MKHFNCVVEYESGSEGDVQILRYRRTFPTARYIKIYHPVDHVNIFVNGKLADNKRIKIFSGSNVEIKVF